MSKHLKKEIFYLSLPVVLLVGCALWMGGASRLARNALTPTVSAGQISLFRMGPIYSQSSWHDEDFQLIVPLVVQDPLHRVRQTSVTLMKPILSGADGKPIVSKIPLRSGIVGYIPDGRPNAAPMTRFDLDRVAPALGQITLSGALTQNNRQTQPFRIVVRPAWFTRPPQTLRLQKVSWVPSQSGGAGDVRIVLLYTGMRQLAVEDANFANTTTVSWTVAPSTTATSGTEPFAQYNLLYNWSPRLESPDGKYNSHRAADAHIWNKYTAFFKGKSSVSANQGPDITSYLSELPIQIKTENARRSGNKITLTHHITGLDSHKGPLVFKTEIGVPGDGFLPVSYALPRPLSK